MIVNTATTWGLASRLLHWVGAGFIVVLVAHGGWMTEFAPRDSRFEHYAWHASVGYALLVLMTVRRDDVMQRMLTSPPRP
jgi:cytochrome b561